MSGKNKSTLILAGIFVVLVALIGSVAIIGWVGSASAQSTQNRAAQPANPPAGTPGAGGRQAGKPGAPVGNQTGETEEEAEPGVMPGGNNAQPPRRPGGPQQGARPGGNQPAPGGRPGGNQQTRPGSPQQGGTQPTQPTEPDEESGEGANTTEDAPPPPPPPAPVLTGTISAINFENEIFTFKTENNTEWAASVTSRTEFLLDGEAASLADLKIDEQIKVIGRINEENHSVEARRVVVGEDNEPTQRAQTNPPARPLPGQVKSVNAAANQFVMTVRERGAENQAQPDVTVIVTAETKFTGYSSLKDLQAGRPVFVVGEKQADNTLKATLVSNQPPRPPAPKPNGSTDSDSATAAN